MSKLENTPLERLRLLFDRYSFSFTPSEREQMLANFAKLEVALTVPPTDAELERQRLEIAAQERLEVTRWPPSWFQAGEGQAAERRRHLEGQKQRLTRPVLQGGPDA